MPGTTRILCASTPHGLATLAAAVGAGCFPAADRRLLLVYGEAAAPGAAWLRGRFDDVASWDDAIRPMPSGWSPRPDDAPMVERHLRLLWDLGDDRVELVLESLHTGPAPAVAQAFADAPVDVCADGLTGYGPTPAKVEPLLGTRVRQLLHLDLVPGLAPLLLGEFDVPARIVPADAYLTVVRGVGKAPQELPSLPGGHALLLGEDLSTTGVLSPREEEALYVRMVRGAVARGHRTLAFTPHPGAPAGLGRALEAAARELGAGLVLLDPSLPAEVLFETAGPALVAGCSSTSLFTASALYGLPVARTGTGTLLNRLTPYQNGARMPLTLADALLPDLEGGQGSGAFPAETLTGLVTAVGFAMQPRVRRDLRPAAEEFLSRHSGPRIQRYFPRRRLTALGLPGGMPEALAFLPRSSTARRMVRRGRALRKAVGR